MGIYDIIYYNILIQNFIGQLSIIFDRGCVAMNKGGLILKYVRVVEMCIEIDPLVTKLWRRV